MARASASLDDVEVRGGDRGDVGQQFAGHGASATARSIWASMIEPPCRASISPVADRGTHRSSSPLAKPASRNNSVSSSALSSRVWKGLIGVSRPGENVIRLGVDTISRPPGLSTLASSLTNCG